MKEPARGGLRSLFLPWHPKVRPLFSQVSRFLVVQPQNRCTAEDALAHPFFQQYVVEEVRHFSPRGKFKVGRPWACCWLQSPGLPPSTTPPPGSLDPPGFPEHCPPLPCAPTPHGSDLASCGCRKGGYQPVSLWVI